MKRRKLIILFTKHLFSLITKAATFSIQIKNNKSISLIFILQIYKVSKNNIKRKKFLSAIYSHLLVKQPLLLTWRWRNLIKVVTKILKTITFKITRMSLKKKIIINIFYHSQIKIKTKTQILISIYLIIH